MARHNIDCLVDTEPMADRISDVSKNVNGTTAAVVGMKVAVLAAEKEGSDHVCKNVNRGFFTLMRSQMTQKIAAKKSRTEALLIELYQQKKRLLDIKSTMERDYQRIASRYSRIIVGINNALKQRVLELDRPVFDLCDRDIATSNNRMIALSGTVPVTQEENMVLSQQIASSVLKGDSMKAIEATRIFLQQMIEQRIITGKVAVDDALEQDSERAIPVIVCSSTIDKNGNQATTITVPDETSPLSQQTIENGIIENVNDLEWKESEQNEHVTQEFNKLIAESASSSRVKDLMAKLYEGSNIQNL